MDRWTEMELLVQTANLGSMARAAQALGLSNAAASRHLASLESRIGARLIQRSTRGLTLTDVGRDFYQSCNGVLADMREAEAAANATQLDPAGTLRLSASLSFSVHHIAPLLKEYASHYPNVRVHVAEPRRGGLCSACSRGFDCARRQRPPQGHSPRRTSFPPAPLQTRHDMKILVLSDLHLEFADFEIPKGLEFDVAVLAGDIFNPGYASVRWAMMNKRLRDKPVVLVPGNHEFYRGRMDRILQQMRELSAGTNVHLLDCDEWNWDGVRFLGATLWTDFALPIQTPLGPVTHVPRATRATETALSDYRLVHVPMEGAPQGSVEEMLGRPLEGRDTLRIHHEQRRWLSSRLDEISGGPTVVVTHHAPHPNSVAQRYASDWVSAGFASHLPGHYFTVPRLWIHGHTHDSFDYRIEHCRVLCNPRGYVNRWSGAVENQRFDPELVVVV